MGSSVSKNIDFEHFCHKLYSTVSQQNKNKNVFLSPTSIVLALSMCTTGAREETLQEMLKVLEVSSIEQLTNIGEEVLRIFSIASQDRQIQLKLANRLYTQKDYKVEQNYINLLRKSFQSDIKCEDFENRSQQIVQTINSWIEEQTNKLISNLLSTNDVTRDTRLILINCIYFKGTWVKQFDEYMTNHNADFYETNDRISKIKLMYQKEKFQYLENKDLRIQIAHLPYKSNNSRIEFVFTVILPNRDVQLEEIEQKLSTTPQLMQQILNSQDTTLQELLLYLPKFKMETTFHLTSVLKQLGIQNAFDELNADFTGIVNKENQKDNLFISEVIHKAFIDVNEKGSEAAAATAVCVAVNCESRKLKPSQIEFKVDRPFLFFIRENRQNITLFAGKFCSKPACII